MKKRTPYDTLGVDKAADAATVKRAYRDRAKRTHSDKGGDDKEMAELNHAYAVLGNPVRRKQYDETGETDDAATTERKMVESLQRLFVTIASQIDFERRDLVATARDAIRRQIDELKSSRKEAERKAEKFANAAKRATVKRGANIVALAFENEARLAETEVKQMEAAAANMERMLAMLDGYEWRVDETPESPFKTNAMWQQWTT